MNAANSVLLVEEFSKLPPMAGAIHRSRSITQSSARKVLVDSPVASPVFL
jgi:hypothetical protein